MPKRTTRRQRERQQHVRRILDVAESIFAAKGFFRATMRQIASKAEFALGTIYSYFQNKRGLYVKVIETKIDDFVTSVLREMQSEPSARGQVEKFIHAKMSFLRGNLSFLRLYLGEVDVPRFGADAILPRKVGERYDSMLHALTETIQRGIREGLFKPMDSKAMARALDGLTNAFAVGWLGGETDRPIDVELGVATELFLHGVSVSD